MSEIDQTMEMVQEWLDGGSFVLNDRVIYPELLKEIHRLRYRISRVNELKLIVGEYYDGLQVRHAVSEFDDCGMCMGTKGGEPGNENRVPFNNRKGYLVMCDYCHAEWITGKEPDHD